MIDWDKDGCGVTEASDMGWAPGTWPASFEARGRTFRKHCTTRDNDNDVMYVTYVNGDGCSVKVFND